MHAGLDVTIGEPDVSPLQLQGPKSGEIMQALFGDSIMDLKYYRLRDSAYGDAVWERIMAAGMPFRLKPGHTSSLRRIEGGMLSYHADADIDTNPFELGLDRLVNLDMKADQALARH